MSEPKNNDTLLVNRGGVDQKIRMDTMAARTDLRDSDYFLVNRNDVDYKCTFGDIAEYLDTPQIIYEVIKTADPKVNSSVVEHGENVQIKTASYKLQEVVPFDAEDPVYEYRWKKTNNGSTVNTSWTVYTGTAETVTLEAVDPYDDWQLECKYTYKEATENAKSEHVKLAVKQVVLVTSPVVDPPYVIHGTKCTAKTAEYKLELASRGVAAPVYEYSWWYEYNGGTEYQDGSWKKYSGAPVDIEYNYRNGIEKYYCKCRYTYNGITEVVESNRAPYKPKPSYINLVDYLSEKLSNLESARWEGEVGDWVYCSIRYKHPDQAKGGMYRFKRSTFDYDTNYDQFERVFDWPDASIDGYGGYMIFSEQHMTKNRDYTYWVSVDAGKNWNPINRINAGGRDVKLHNVISKLSSNTFRTLVNPAGQTERFKEHGDVTFNADATITITNYTNAPDPRGYFWLYNSMDWKGSVQCVPDSNGYFFGSTQDWSTFNRWTDKDWNATTVPETMACPSFKDQPANTYVVFPELCIWDEVTQSYVLQLEFKENGTNELKGGGVYHFKWGDSQADLHPANSAIGAKTRYDWWCKVIANGQSLGWQVYKQNGSFFRYDVGGDYKIKQNCTKPTHVYMGCNLNRCSLISGGDLIWTGDDCK